MDKELKCLIYSTTTEHGALEGKKQTKSTRTYNRAYSKKKQYKYDRDTMLSCSKEIPMVKLKETATEMYRGAGIKRDQVTQDGIPCVRYGEIYTTYNVWFEECVSHTKLEYVLSTYEARQQKSKGKMKRG